MKYFAIITLVVIIVAVILIQNNSAATPSDNLVDQTPVAETEDLNWENHEFPEVGLSFSAPFEMEVSGEKLDENTFTLYVQRSEYSEGEEYYQLYGMYNLNNTRTVIKDDLKTELNPDTITETTISGFEAVQGQYKGERNRFVTFIITDRGLFTLATSQPTEDNRLLTNTILDTFELE